jgi:hypothetical protein
VKGELIKDFIADENDHLTQVRAIVEGILSDELNRVFPKWVKTNGNMIEAEGKYLSKQNCLLMQKFLSIRLSCLILFSVRCLILEGPRPRGSESASSEGVFVEGARNHWHYMILYDSMLYPGSKYWIVKLNANTI